jgi:hypothetical protein
MASSTPSRSDNELPGTWLDQVVATPTVGVHVDTNWRTQDDYLRCLRPLIRQWASQGDLQLTNEPLGTQEFRTADGYLYKAGVDNLVVAFTYSANVKGPTRGPALPEVVYHREFLAYRELLTDLLSKMQGLSDAVFDSEERVVRRIGVVAQCQIAREDCPPGVVSLLNHLGKPWDRDLEACDAKLLAVLSECDDSYDRCHHVVVMQQTQSGPAVRLNVDWQRVFKTPKGGLDKL